MVINMVTSETSSGQTVNEWTSSYLVFELYVVALLVAS